MYNSFCIFIISFYLFLSPIHCAYVVGSGTVRDNVQSIDAEAPYWGGDGGFVYIGQTFTSMRTIQMYSFYIRPYAGNAILLNEKIRGVIMEFSEPSFYPTKIVWEGTSTLGTRRGPSASTVRGISGRTYYKVTVDLNTVLTLNPSKVYVLSMYLLSQYASDQYAVAGTSGSTAGGFGYATVTNYPPPINRLYWNELSGGAIVAELVLGDCTSDPCQNGGTCIGYNLCSCINNYKGNNCSIATCSTPCKNNGTCVAPNKCSCGTGWTGSSCATPICTNGCSNGGTCVAPNTCSCKGSWSGPNCTTPICANACLNGGTCIAPNVCTCATGWNGLTCTNPICTRACVNGSCEAPNFCHCNKDWFGEICDTPGCDPATTCGGHGTCAEDGSCNCNSEFDPSSNCGSCLTGFLDYPECFSEDLLPKKPTAINYNSSIDTILLKWEKDPNSEGFNLEWKVNDVWISTYNGSESSHMLTSLAQNFTYFFRIYSYNSYGRSEIVYFNASTVNAGFPASTAPPSFGQYDRSFVEIKWNHVEDSGILPVLGYLIRMVRSSLSSSRTVRAEEVTEWNVTEHTHSFRATGLEPSSTYEFSIAAFNSLGPGDFSSVSNFTTPEKMCGDGACDLNENCTTCFMDCGACGYMQCNCSDRGICQKGLCNCKDNWYGDKCQYKDVLPVTLESTGQIPRASIILDSSAFANTTFEQNTSVVFDIKFTSIREVDKKGEMTSTYALKTSELHKTVTPLATNYIYQTILPNQANVSISISVYHAPTVVVFADETIQIPNNGVKYLIRIENWDFAAFGNRLVLSMDASLQSSSSTGPTPNPNTGCGAESDGIVNANYDTGTDNVRTISIQINGVTLYGKFIESAYIDGNIRTVQFLRNKITNTVDILVPHFWGYAEIDPNFQVLVNPKHQPPKNICDVSSEEVEKIKKSNKRIGFSIAASVVPIVVIAIVVAVVYLVKVKNADEKFSSMLRKVSTSSMRS